MLGVADGRLRPYPTSAERGPQTASWRGLTERPQGADAGLGAMGVIIPSQATVSACWSGWFGAGGSRTCGMTGGHILADFSG